MEAPSQRSPRQPQGCSLPVPQAAGADLIAGLSASESTLQSLTRSQSPLGCSASHAGLRAQLSFQKSFSTRWLIGSPCGCIYKVSPQNACTLNS